VSLYAIVLFVHSWLRYAVLGLGLLVLGLALGGARRDAAWSERAERAHKGFLSALDFQMLLGLLLYFWLSPISAAALADFGAAMKNAHLRFFGVEHIVTMLFAVAAAHVGRVKSRRKEGKARYKSVLIAQLLWLALTCAAIPWPGLDIGRPLFRM
jgi:hypothetical protein